MLLLARIAFLLSFNVLFIKLHFLFRLLITIADEVLLQICFPFLQKADGPMHFTASSAPISIATEENALKSDTDPKIFAEVSVKMHSLKG